MIEMTAQESDIGNHTVIGQLCVFIFGLMSLHRWLSIVISYDFWLYNA